MQLRFFASHHTGKEEHNMRVNLMLPVTRLIHLFVRDIIHPSPSSPLTHTHTKAGMQRMKEYIFNLATNMSDAIFPSCFTSHTQGSNCAIIT